MIKLASPSFDDDELRLVCDVLASGNLVQGRYVAEFEHAVGDYLGIKEAVAVSSGTAALHLSLLAVGVGPGDIVITTSYSFIATANVIELCRAHPLFVDIDSRTFNMDPQCLEDTLMSLDRQGKLRNVKAIIPVHTFGQLADMAEICRIAEMYSCPIIEDAACALGASLQGTMAGKWGKLGCFSFHPRKILTTGEGGMIVTNDTSLAERLKVLRNHGQCAVTEGMDFIMPGYNYRMMEIQGALGSSQIGKLDQMIFRRRNLAVGYSKLLEKSPIILPESLPEAFHVYQSYVIMLPDEGISRQDIIQRLKEEDIEASIGTVHMPMTTFYRQQYGLNPGDFPVTDYISARALSLPIHERITEIDQLNIVTSLSKILYP